MTELVQVVRDGWEKTWPGISCALNGGLPEFVLAPDPDDLGISVPVFCFHTVDPLMLEADLDFLRRNAYATITAEVLADHMDGVTVAPNRSVVLTFDDGPVNLFNTVFPLLRAYGFKAVAFIAPWFHEGVGEEGADGPGRDRVCTWREIELMHESGCIDFQSHTWQHRYVPRWPEPLPMIGMNGNERAAMDVRCSMSRDFNLARETIERRLGKVVRHLAFPRYRGTDEAIEIGIETGYQAFWWGALPRRPLNRPGDPLTHIVRMSGEFVRRLPGAGRISLSSLVRLRCARQVRFFGRRLVGEPRQERHR